MAEGDALVPGGLCAETLEALPVGVMLLDRDGVLVYENAAARAAMGVAEGETSPAIGRPLKSLPSMAHPTIQGMLARLMDGHPIESTVIEFDTIFDKTVTLAVDAGPAGPDGYFLMLRDLALAGPLAGRLLSAQRMEFVGVAVTGVIHDLNNMITALGGTVELLRKGRKADEALLGSLDGMLRRSRDVTRRLLEVTRPGEDRRLPMDLRTPVRQTANLLRHSFGSGFDVKCSLPDSQVAILGNRTTLLQCMFNLGVNARDAMGGKGTFFLDLSISRDPARCREQGWPGFHVAVLTASDTGPGIPEVARERLFEPFFSTKRPDKGTGMGLSVVKRAVVDHNGTLELVELEDRGAIFRIELPMHPAAVVDDEPTRAMSLPASALLAPGTLPLTGQRILVADDEPSVRIMLAEALEARGAEVEAVANGVHAVQAAAEAKAAGRAFDAALIDIRMPGMPGPAAIQRIRALDATVRLVATSGLEPDEDSAEELHASGAAFVSKPFEVPDVVDAILTR
jgi:two-component system, cell cycle sensor histidine kinase and response regulator CckA